MKSFRVLVIAAPLMFAVGCAKKEPVAAPPPPALPPKPAIVLVPEKEMSGHYLAVSKHLELGGTLYGYADIDGDVARFAGTLQGVVEQIAKQEPQLAPFAKQDFGALCAMLGLTDIKAVGVSSVPDGTGFFRNSMYLHTPDGRNGFMAALGGKPAPFAKLKYAPTGTDFYAESEIDMGAVYQTVKAVVTKVAGEPAAQTMEQKIKEAGERAAVSLLNLFNGLKGHVVFITRFEDDQPIVLPGREPLTLPGVSFYLAIDGAAPALEQSLDSLPMLTKRTEDDLTIYEPKGPLPIKGLNPVLARAGSTLILASSPAFLLECQKQSGGLATQPGFQQAIARFGREGNSLTYATPRCFERIKSMSTLVEKLPPDARQVWQMVLNNVPSPDRPLVTVRRNLQEGILLQSYLHRSMKQDVAAVMIYNPVTVGVMAAMAIPAFQKVRESSQQKAVLNNLRMLSAAADQYYLENGKDSATYNDLVGPDKYVRSITPVAGEDYRRLQFKQGQTLRVRLPNGKTVQYTP